jgi:hypothetical protein
MSPRAATATMTAVTRVRPLENDRNALALFAIGGGLLYLVVVIGITLALGADVETLGWIGFGVVVAVVLAVSGGLALFLVREARTAGSGAQPALPAAPAETTRVLVVADERCAGAELCAAIAPELGTEGAEALVVAPALVSTVHYLDSDVESAREAAQARADEIVASLAAAGYAARGTVGSESPLEAIADALAGYPADKVIVATHPAAQTNWLERGVVDRARRLYDVPVVHVIVPAVPGTPVM